MKLTRRDLLLWGAGATAGLVVTPVPWKLLDDISIRTQTWPWIPQPARGPVDVQQSFCTLCPQGCGLRVHMAAGWPVGVAGMPNHPVSRGALCPLAFGAHQLRWHPDRLRTVRHRGSTSSWNEARVAFRKACGEGPLLIVDGRPGRAASRIFQNFVLQHGGGYHAIPSPETQAFAPYQYWTGVSAAEMGYDLETAHTILSFGAPMLDGWGTPGRFTRLWAERAAGSADPQLRLIQVDASLTRTAARAWQWVSVQAGGEAALAAALAHVLLEDRLVAAHGPIPPLTLTEAASQSGLSVDAVRELARSIVSRPPTLVVASDANPAVAALNVLLGAVGARGGVARRSKAPQPEIMAKRNDKPVRAVLIDSTVPWDFSPPIDAEVFRFAAWDGGSSRADWLLPALGFLEESTDVPTPPASAVETYAVASALVKAPAEARSAVEFLAGVDASLSTVDQAIHARCQDLFREKAGTLTGAQSPAVASVGSAQKMEEQLRKGAVWVGDPPRAGSLRCELKTWPTASPPSTPHALPGWAVPVLPPLATKLYQESELRDPAERRNA